MRHNGSELVAGGPPHHDKLRLWRLRRHRHEGQGLRRGGAGVRDLGRYLRGQEPEQGGHDPLHHPDPGQYDPDPRKSQGGHRHRGFQPGGPPGGDSLCAVGVRLRCHGPGERRRRGHSQDHALCHRRGPGGVRQSPGLPAPEEGGGGQARQGGRRSGQWQYLRHRRDGQDR